MDLHIKFKPRAKKSNKLFDNVHDNDLYDIYDNDNYDNDDHDNVVFSSRTFTSPFSAPSHPTHIK